MMTHRLKGPDYRHISQLLRERGDVPRDLINLLCEIFAEDNPRFKPDVFRQQCDGVKEEQK